MASRKYKAQHCLQKDSGKCRNAWCETTFQVGEKSLDAVYEDKSKKINTSMTYVILQLIIAKEIKETK